MLLRKSYQFLADLASPGVGKVHAPRLVRSKRTFKPFQAVAQWLQPSSPARRPRRRPAPAPQEVTRVILVNTHDGVITMEVDW